MGYLAKGTWKFLNSDKGSTNSTLEYTTVMCMVIYISFYVGCDTINPLPAEHDFVVFKLFYQITNIGNEIGV